jgi:pSer/pThr/pTyr-binding forkhead associated (FHA) protein
MFGVLQVIEGPDKGRTYPVPQGKTIHIGRGQQATICLTDQQASRVHCRIHLEGSNALLTDAGSSAGTWINGERVTQRVLQAGDILRVGETQMAFRWSDTDEKPTEAWESVKDHLP